ncbi:MAG: heavy metal-associated domain-containing protein [Corynebacterium sp.]|uniref:heavy-metal-associated domain-containing protein n=1 Tax=Corynebacterium sp. TaxID=1720 RepID=UPI0026DC2748|nr:heavy metal-associated domain-containing protein [Corynebacterium sp.]MDO5030275.1 heavy metal-associated domain-containing protein [Corynebacterium sp.]
MTTHSTFRAEGFSCPSCVKKIENQVGAMSGVEGVEVKFASSRIEVDHADSVSRDDIIAEIGKAGYKATYSAF